MSDAGAPNPGRQFITRRTLLRASGAVLTPAFAWSGESRAQQSAGTQQAAIGVNVGYPMRADDTAANLKAFELVIGRQVDYVVDFGAQSTWKEAISSSAHAMRMWRSDAIGNRRKLLWHQPLTVRGTPLSEVAAGKHDSTFETLAANIRNTGFQDAIINLGWDMNGEWTAWSAKTDAAAAYIAAYKRAAAIFKKVSPSFKLCWSPARHEQAITPQTAYPGDNSVDLVGMSILIASLAPGTDTAEFFDSNVLGHGAKPIAGRLPYSLAWLAEFAKEHQKPIIIPEFAIGTEIPSGQISGTAPVVDDDVIVTRLSQWIRDNQVVLHCWRDLPNTAASPLHSRISRTSLVAGAKPSDPVDERPRLAAAYRKAWGKG